MKDGLDALKISVYTADNRIMVRRDKLITTFMGFVYLGCIYIN